MTTKQTITFGQDLDGFLGYDPQSIATIDVEASQANYERKIAKRIHEIYPQLTVEFAWNGNSRYSYLMDEPEYASLQDDLEMITDQVYGLQDFWVYK